MLCKALLSSLLLSFFAIGCGSSSDDPTNTDERAPSAPKPSPATPSSPADVQTTYDTLGNACNDGSLSRRFRVVEANDGRSIWSAPEGDPGSLGAMKTRDRGWTPLLAASAFLFEGIGDRMTLTSADQAARCGAVREIFTPYGKEGRSEFVSILVYAGDHEHRDDEVGSIDAPVRLRGYLALASGVREEIQGGTAYRDVREQHLPISISCKNPVKVERERAVVSAAEAASLDPATCTEGASGITCIRERFVHTDNACTIVATAVTYRTAAGSDLVLSFGARLETGKDADATTATLVVDRYAFHDKR